MSPPEQRKCVAEEEPGAGTVVAVHRSATHTFGKTSEPVVRLVAGHGVEGDAHAGPTVRHRSRVAVDPTQPNLRQVHLVQAELLEELRRQGFEIAPGNIGENVTTHGIDLRRLPRGTHLHLGREAVIEVTGLRNPCPQLDTFRPGLRAAVLDHDAAGLPIRKAGIMAVVLRGGEVRPGDRIGVELPPRPHVALDRV